MTNTLEQKSTVNSGEKKKREFFSMPLFKQSVKSNWVLWLTLTLGCTLIFVIINMVVGTKQIFTNINMNKVATYVSDEGMSWFQILGLLDNMGFNLNRIQTMSQIDMNAVMNDLIYKITGVLLPMIYVMITCNRLIAAQVSDGSMAYILSTPTNRKKVLRTQYFFMIMSVIAMYVVIFLGAYLSGIAAFLINPPAKNVLNFGAMTLRTLLYCFGSLVAMFALSGVCFGASCWFNKSSKSIALGGGACILAFICCILGLFGNKVFVSVGVGVQAMSIFDYLTIYTLIDTETMGNFAKAANGIGLVSIGESLAWIWKLGALFGIGVITALLGAYKFVKKDLPL